MLDPLGHGEVVVHTPPTHATLIAVPEDTTEPLSVYTRSQQQSQAGAPPHFASNASNAACSATFRPSAST